MKRLISILLVLTMIFSFGGVNSFTALAAEPEEAETSMSGSGTDESLSPLLGATNGIAVKAPIPLLGAANPDDNTDLENFIYDVVIHAETGEDGAYIIESGTEYFIELFFRENPEGLQFNNTSMTYAIPDGLNPVGHEGDIDVSIKVGTQTYTIKNNHFEIRNGVITFTWNKTDPNYPRVTAAANVSFSLNFWGVFTGEETVIEFSDEIKKEIEIDNTNSVTTTKKAEADIQNDRVNYTATVQSSGTSKNVVLTDTITGDWLTLDPDSIRFTSSTGQPVNATGGASGNSFTYTIPKMVNGEVITVTYSAIIDPTQLQMINGKIVKQTGNTFKAVSEGDPPGHETTVETEVDYTPGVRKESPTELVDQQDGTVKKLLWTVFVNGTDWTRPKVSAAGTQITDTIDEEVRDITSYSGDGITVTRYDAQGRQVGQETIPYDQLDYKDDYSWIYTIPQSDAGKVYRYEITYTTDVETKDLTLPVQIGNTVVSNGGKSDEDTGRVIPVGGVTDINKHVTEISKEDLEVSWETIVDVPATGLPKAVVYDVYPTVRSETGETLIEKIKPGTNVVITGLQSGEDYSINYNGSYNGRDAMIIIFTRNGQPGLIGTGYERTIKIEYKTEINPVWLEEAKTDDGKVTHLNAVWLEHDGWVGDESNAYIKPFKVDKSGMPVGTRNVDGVELPVYRYEITFAGTDSYTFTITDKFDTSILELYNGDEFDDPEQQYTPLYVYGGESESNTYSRFWNGDHAVRYEENSEGVIFHIDSNNLTQYPDPNENFWERPFMYYRFVYYLTVKDEEALNTLAMRAVKSETGETEIVNKVEWEGETDTTTVVYKYNGLDKELLTSDEDLIADHGDIFADFRITLNPAGLTLNGHKPLIMTDTVTNLSVDITSIHAEPAAGVSWDMSGNTVTYTVPDDTKVVITYRARVVFENSEDLTVTFSNHAEMKTVYNDYESGTGERHNSGEGTGSVPVINLMKYEAGNMAKRLAGAKFILLDANKQPVQGTMKEGTPVEPYDLIFTTDEDGMITVTGDKGQDGWTLLEDTRYYLREIEAPPYYMLATFDYSFQISSDGTTNYSQYIYHNGDTMSAKNYPGTDVQIEKVWTDGYGNHESDKVTVKLQQKIGDGEWSDMIREEVKKTDGSYVWQDTEGKVLVLDKSNDWKGMFASLPLEVPSVLPEPESGDVAVEYRIIETKVNDIDVTPGESDPTAGTYPGGTVTITRTSDAEHKYVYTITNTPDSGSLKIKKEVTENGSEVTSDAAKSKLAGDYMFMVYTDEECQIPLQKGNKYVTVTLTIPEDGSSATSTEITDIPAGTYYVKEISPAWSNPSPVTNPVEVTVETGKTGEETVIATITNDYRHVEAAPEVNKSINVWPENVTSFDFTLTAGTNDAGVPTPMPASGGETASAASTTAPAVFGMITFEAPGTYNYTIKEVVPADDDPDTPGIQKNGVTYTDTEYPVQIVVEADSTTGQLKTPVITYGEALDQNSLTVTNTYDAKGEAVFSAKKAANTNLGDRTFKFQLLDANGDLIETSAAVKQNETVTFTSIKYTLADLDGAASKDFTYKIREVIPEEATAENDYTVDGVKYDTKVVTTVVTVTNDGNGTLSVKYDGNESFSTPEFENDYAAEGEAVIKATKFINDWGKAKSFTFTLSSVGGAPMPEGSSDGKLTMQATKADPVVIFGTIKYTEPGTYMYTIVETDDGIEDITYDTTPHNVVVTVSDPNKDGNLVCDVKYDDQDSLTIVNKRIPNTGAESYLMLWIALIYGFGVWLAVLVKDSKRRNAGT